MVKSNLLDFVEANFRCAITLQEYIEEWECRLDNKNSEMPLPFPPVLVPRPTLLTEINRVGLGTRTISTLISSNITFYITSPNSTF